VDATYQLVGDKQTPCTRLGIAVGQDTSGVMRFANIVCWRQLAERMRGAVHGDAVIAVGKIKTREYNGKTYSDLHADWADLVPASLGQVDEQGFVETEDDELPF